MKKHLFAACALALVTFTTAYAGVGNIPTRDFSKFENWTQKTDTSSKKPVWNKDSKVKISQDTSSTGFDHLHRPVKTTQP